MIRNESLANCAKTTKGPPAARWHIRQWQYGSALELGALVTHRPARIFGMYRGSGCNEPRFANPTLVIFFRVVFIAEGIWLTI